MREDNLTNQLLDVVLWLVKEYEEGNGTIPDGLYNAARIALKKSEA